MSEQTIVVQFDVPVMSAAQYDGIIRDLEEAGLGQPDGRLYHVATANGGGWFVLDVWESEEKLGRFAETLMPSIAKNVGITPPPPQIRPVYNIIER